MTVNIDGVEPNIFPDVDDLDARDAGRNVEVFLDVRVDGKPTPVTAWVRDGRDTVGPAWEVDNRPVDHREADC
jgi:hypothetical protein